MCMYYVPTAIITHIIFRTYLYYGKLVEYANIFIKYIVLNVSETRDSRVKYVTRTRIDCAG